MVLIFLIPLMHLACASNEKGALRQQQSDIDGQVESLPDRIVEAKTASAVAVHEARTDKFEHDKIARAEKLEDIAQPKGRLEGALNSPEYSRQAFVIFINITFDCIKLRSDRRLQGL